MSHFVSSTYSTVLATEPFTKMTWLKLLTSARSTFRFGLYVVPPTALKSYIHQVPKKCYDSYHFLAKKSRGNSSTILKFVLGSTATFCLVKNRASINADCKSVHPSHAQLCDRFDDSENSQLETVEAEFNWTHFWQLLHPQFHFFILAAVSALVVALCNIQIPLVLGSVVGVVARFSQSVESDSNFLAEIAEPSLKLAKLYLVQSVFTFSYIAFLTHMGERMASDLRQQLFTSLLKQDISFYDQHKTGEILNRFTSDIQDFKSSFKMCMSQGLRSMTQVIGCSVSLYMISPHMAGWTAIIVPGIVSIGTALGSLLRSISRRAQQQLARSSGVANECLGNIRTVRAFAMEDAELDLFSREVEKSRILNEALGLGIGLFQAGSNLFLNGMVMVTLYAGGNSISSGQLRSGDLMSFIVAAQTIQRSLTQLSVLFGHYVRGVSAGARVFEYIKLESQIPIKGGKEIPYHSLYGTLEFKNVSFAYPSRPEQEVLHNFNLRIPAGAVIAVVGSSGGGKSTIAQLIERFYDVTSGVITLDGVNIKKLNPEWLRGEVIGFINQEPVLFATSILENIRYGHPEATDKQVIDAACLANAHDFIMNFTNGYQTLVGDRGVTMSGGQKQRIAIARALLKDPQILILDEATSALDAESEAIVQAALEKCLKGRTVLIIAHRLSTIQNADAIAVISKGKLAELGTHEELKKLGGIYSDLIRQQQREEQSS